jgi:hypothetical protein
LEVRDRGLAIGKHWNEAMIATEQLEDAVRAGRSQGLGYKQIAAKSGVPVGAVARKARRLGLGGNLVNQPQVNTDAKPGALKMTVRANYCPKDRKHTGAVSGDAQAKQTKHIETAKDGAYIRRFPYADGPGVEFSKLDEHGKRMCRWPCASKGTATHFCGAVQAEGSSYCAAHREIAWAAPREQRPRIQEAA